MAVRILELPNGHVSLEFEPDEVLAVVRAIQQIWGAPEMTAYVASQSVEFGGCKFVFQNEWHDPCLISLTAEGNPLLRQLADHLAAQS